MNDDQPKSDLEAAAVHLMKALKESLRQAKARREATEADHRARLAADTDDPYKGYGPCFCLGCIGDGPCEHADTKGS